MFYRIFWKIGDQRDLKYGVYRINGSGATVQSLALLTAWLSHPLITRRRCRASTLSMADMYKLITKNLPKKTLKAIVKQLMQSHPPSSYFPLSLPFSPLFLPLSPPSSLPFPPPFPSSPSPFPPLLSPSPLSPHDHTSPLKDTDALADGTIKDEWPGGPNISVPWKERLRRLRLD